MAYQSGRTSHAGRGMRCACAIIGGQNIVMGDNKVIAHITGGMAVISQCRAIIGQRPDPYIGLLILCAECALAVQNGRIKRTFLYPLIGAVSA